MAGWVALIHQSVFQVSSHSMYRPPAPPPSTRVDESADLKADEIIRRRSSVLRKQREEVGISVPAPPGHMGKHQLSVTYFSGKGNKEENPQNYSLRGNPILQGTLCAEKIIRASSFDSVPFA